MNKFKPIEQADIYIGNISGLTSVVEQMHTSRKPTEAQLLDAYNQTKDIVKALSGYVELLDDALQPIIESELEKYDSH